MSQEALADRCGLPQSKISRIENDITTASADDIEAIAKAMGLSMPEFYGAVAKAS